MNYGENFETESLKIEYGIVEPMDINPEDLAPETPVMELEFNINSHTSVRSGLPF